MANDDNEKKHRLFLEKSFALAERSKSNGNHPFGALLVLNNTVVAIAENTVISSKDCTAHAELNLIRKASRMFSPEELKDATLYTSTEPCAMCAGAIYWSGVRHVVFGCSAENLGKMASGSFVVPCREIFSRGREPVYVEGPFFEDRAKTAHEDFWTESRKKADLG